MESTPYELLVRPSLIKVTGISVEEMLKIEHKERLWRVGNVALFILRSLDEGKIQQFAKFPQD
jgi:hypothetical protein